MMAQILTLRLKLVGLAELSLKSKASARSCLLNVIKSTSLYLHLNFDRNTSNNFFSANHYKDYLKNVFEVFQLPTIPILMSFIKLLQ
jgi:hypothetical protein